MLFKNVMRTAMAPVVLASLLFGQQPKTYFSKLEWSGQCGDWSGWHNFTTPPAPASYVVDSVKYELTGDPTRGCASWGECSAPRINPNGSVTIEWRTQGHNEDCTFRSLPINVPVETRYNGRGGVGMYRRGGGATESGIRVDVTYRKQ